MPTDPLPRQGDGIERIKLAAQMAGHGFHPEDVVRMARHYLDVPLLTGSIPLSASELAGLNAQLDRAVESRRRVEGAKHAVA